MQNFSYENQFDLHENELVGETHFHKNGFALRLVLPQRQTRTQKWAMHKNSKKKKKNGTPVSSVLKTLNGCQSFSHSICFSCWKTDIKPLEAVISNSLFFLFPCASSRVLVALDVTAQLEQVLALHGSEPTGSDTLTCIDNKKNSEGKEISVFFLCLRQFPMYWYMYMYMYMYM